MHTIYGTVCWLAVDPRPLWLHMMGGVLKIASRAFTLQLSPPFRLRLWERLDYHEHVHRQTCTALGWYYWGGRYKLAHQGLLGSTSTGLFLKTSFSSLPWGSAGKFASNSYCSSFLPMSWRFHTWKQQKSIRTDISLIVLCSSLFEIRIPEQDIWKHTFRCEQSCSYVNVLLTRQAESRWKIQDMRNFDTGTSRLGQGITIVSGNATCGTQMSTLQFMCMTTCDASTSYSF